MKTSLRRLFLALASASILTAGSFGATVYGDGDFNLADYNYTFTDYTFDGLNWIPNGTDPQFLVVPPGGGNPAAYLEIHNVLINSAMLGSLLHTPSVYDPGAQGAISSIVFSMDFIHLSGGFQGEALGSMIMQGGNYYVGPSLTSQGAFQWTPYGSFPQIESGFARYNPLDYGFNPFDNPDFSEDGGPIMFGIYSANQGSGVPDLVAGIDNWSYSIESLPLEGAPVPEAAPIWSAGVAMALAALKSGKRRAA